MRFRFVSRLPEIVSALDIDAVPNVREAPDWAWELVPKELPARWTRHEDARVGLWFGSDDGLRVFFSARVEADGKRWIHVSCSRHARLPSWDDLGRVKTIFMGSTRLAVQVFPPEKDYVNDNPYVLHLWSCLDGDPTPDFRVDVGGRASL